MLLFESDNGYKKICIWRDEIPFRCVQKNKMHLSMQSGSIDWHIGTICIEAKLSARHISNYAMICMKYVNNQDNKVDIVVDYGRNDTLFKSQVLPFNKSIHIGIDKEFADAIYEYFQEYPQKELPSGTIEVFGGGYDEVGSSNFSFKKVMQLLVYVFQNSDNLSYEELKAELFYIM